MLSGLPPDIKNIILLALTCSTKVADGDIFCLLERKKDLDESVCVCVCVLLPCCIEEQKRIENYRPGSVNGTQKVLPYDSRVELLSLMRINAFGKHISAVKEERAFLSFEVENVEWVCLFVLDS